KKYFWFVVFRKALEQGVMHTRNFSVFPGAYVIQCASLSFHPLYALTAITLAGVPSQSLTRRGRWVAALRAQALGGYGHMSIWAYEHMGISPYGDSRGTYVRTTHTYERTYVSST